METVGTKKRGDWAEPMDIKKPRDSRTNGDKGARRLDGTK